MTATRLPNGSVRLQSGGLSITCDPNFGSAPLDVQYNGIRIINSFPGVGMQTTWETGNDPTQASPNGPGQNQIATVSGLNPNRVYYGRETAFSKTGLLATQQTCPFFWISFDAVDDAIPPESKPGWRTKYLTPNFIPDWTQLPVPIYWEGSAAKTSGLFFVGNEMKELNFPWSKRLCEIDDGMVAFQINISLQKASPDAYAGVLFRKTVPPDATEAEAWGAPGLMFLVNFIGGWALHQFPEGAPIASGNLVMPDVKKLLSTQGAVLEARTYGERPSAVQLFIEGKLLADIETTADGPHFGLIGACNHGSIMFGNRAVFDRRYDLNMMLNTNPSGVSMEYFIEENPWVTEIPLLYRANTGLFFFDADTFQNGWVEAGGIKNPGVVEFATIPPPYRAVSTKHNLVFEIDALNPLPVDGHALVANNLIHFNMLPVSANNAPIPVPYAGCKLQLSVKPYP